MAILKFRLTGCTSSRVEETKYPVVAGSCKVIPVRPWLKGNTNDIIGMFEGIKQIATIGKPNTIIG